MKLNGSISRVDLIKKMQRPTAGLLALLITFGLCGCYADKPIGSADSEIFDEALLGMWLWPEAGEPGGRPILVARFNDREYVVGSPSEFALKETLRVYVTQVGDDRFLNAQELLPAIEKRTYFFARYRFLDPDTVQLDLPRRAEFPDAIKSSQELVASIVNRGQDPTFYEEKSLVIKRIVDKQ